MTAVFVESESELFIRLHHEGLPTFGHSFQVGLNELIHHHTELQLLSFMLKLSF